MDKVGFIGAGNMGYAIMSGLLKLGMKENIAFTDKSLDRRIYIVEELDIKPFSSNKELVEESKYVVLAIKPQFVEDVVNEIKEVVTNKKVIISVSPISISKLKEMFGKDIRIVRVMPNTPALVAEAMSVISFDNSKFIEEEKNVVISMFNSLGEVEIMDEMYMNAIIPISGSSPAYVYMFIEAIADSAVKYGIDRKIAYKLAAQSVLGSAKMILETGQHPGVLKDKVCSPGGTTIEAVISLEQNGFKGAVMEAIDCCYEKAKAISDK